MNMANTVRELLPSEQGLRQDVVVPREPCEGVRELLPSEQGLRQFKIILIYLFYVVRELLPSEQGLRLQGRFLLCKDRYCQRVTSIRTRIKT